MENRRLAIQASDYPGARSVPHHVADAGLTPAFLDKRTGRIEIARTRVGLPASTHVIDWLPREWAKSVTDKGRVSSLRPEIISGYIRDGIFYTREEIADH